MLNLLGGGAAGFAGGVTGVLARPSRMPPRFTLSLLKYVIRTNHGLPPARGATHRQESQTKLHPADLEVPPGIGERCDKYISREKQACGSNYVSDDPKCCDHILSLFLGGL
jgi:hypothetical protein